MKTSNVADILPLSPSQESMLYHYRLDRTATMYHGQHVLHLAGPLDLDAFRQAIDRTVEANEMLRAVFRWEGIQSPVQIIARQKRMETAYEDWSALGEELQAARLEQLLGEDMKRPFQLDSGDTMRICTVKTAQDKYKVVWSFHHIIMDGWSSGVMLHELFANYGEAVKGQETRLRPKAKYKSYLMYLREARENPGIASYWKKYLHDFTAPTALPFHTEQAKASFYRSLRTRLSTETTEALERLARTCEVTLGIVLQLGWSALISNYSGLKDVLFEVAHTGRAVAVDGIEDMIGLFVSTYPQRTRFDATTTIVQLLHCMSREQYERSPFLVASGAEFKQYSGVDARSVLAHSLFLFQNYPLDKALGGLNLDLAVEKIDSYESANYPLIVEVKQDEEGLDIHYNYDASLLQETTMNRMLQQYKHVLTGMVDQPDRRMIDLPLFTMEEEPRLFAGYRDIVRVPADRCVHQLFDETADRLPDAVALIDSAHQLSYAKLKQRADRLAHVITGRVSGSHQPIAVLCGRSTEMIVALLGIMKSGSFYIPLDPVMPIARMQQIIAQMQPVLLITDDMNYERAGELGIPRLNVQQSSLSKQAADHAIKTVCSSSAAPAYAMFTSGSTGVPKGVVVHHDQLVNSLWWHNDFVGIDAATRTLQCATLTFDASVVEIFCTLLGGGTLVLPQDDDNKSPERLVELIRRHHLNLILVVPTMYRALLEHVEQEARGALASVTRVICTGEMMTASLVRQHDATLPQATLYNLYGPTENSISASGYRVPRKAHFTGPIPIGKPSYNVSVYLLDEDMRLLPRGSTGELYVGGMGVTEGYIGDEAGTAAAYLETPYGRLYRTGDLARWLEDGNLQYYGRKDYQVKIRGNRVELEEIEAVVRAFPAVREAAALAVAGTGEEQMLALCYVASATINLQQLREHVAARLPDYMIPSLYKRLDSLPYTTSGKVDKTQLRQLGYTSKESRQSERVEDPIEAALSMIWRKLLGVDSVGREAHFYTIGGHSLKAAQLITRIQMELSVKLTLQDIARYPTLREQAAVIAQRSEHRQPALEPIPQAEAQTYYRASPAQTKMYILRQLEGENTSYNMSGILAVVGSFAPEKATTVIRRLIDRHEALRTSFFLEGEEVYQQVHATVVFEPDQVPMKGRTIEQAMQAYIRPFDLSQAPLIRVAIIEAAPEEHYLLFDSHHIVLDGISLNLLMEQFRQMYEGRELPPVHLQYKDYTSWFWQREGDERWLAQQSYWRRQFEDRLPLLSFPTDYARPSVKTFEGDHHVFRIGGDLAERLTRFASQRGSTVHIILLAAYYVLLRSYTAQEDLVVGSLVTGRDHPDLDTIVGVFVNFLPIRCYPKGSSTIRDFLDAVEQSVWQAYDHASYPFENIVEPHGKAIPPGRNPLFDTMLIYHNQREQADDPMAGEVQLMQMPYESATSKLDFKIDITPAQGAYRCVLEYNTQLLARKTMEAFADHFLYVLNEVLAHPEQRLQEVELPWAEKGRLKRAEEQISLHHIGIAVPSIEAGSDPYRALCIDMGAPLIDPLQHVRLAIGGMERGLPIELVAPVDSTSPVYSLLTERGPGPYHLCFAVADIDAACQRLQRDGIAYEAISDKKPAVLFDGAAVAFLYMQGLGLIELVETGSAAIAGPSEDTDVAPSVRVRTEAPEAAVRGLRSLGYTVAEYYVCMRSHETRAVLRHRRGMLIELLMLRGGAAKQLLKTQGNGVAEVIYSVPDLMLSIDQLAAAKIGYRFADRQGSGIRPVGADYLLLVDGTEAAHRRPLTSWDESGTLEPERSCQQERWLLQEQQEAAAANVVFGFDCSQTLDPGRLESALRSVLGRHPLLWPSEALEEFGLTRWDLREPDEGWRRARLAVLMEEERSRPLPVAAGRSARFSLVRGGGSSRLIGCLHASVCDAPGVRQLLQEAVAAYAGESISSGSASSESASARSFGYATFARKQRQQVKYGLLESERQRVLERSRAWSYPFGIGGKAGATAQWILGGAGFHALQQVASAARQTVDAILLTSYVLLLRQMTQDVVVTTGVVVDGRDAEYGETIGNFSQIAPLCVDTGGATSFVQLLDRTSEALTAASALAAYPSMLLEAQAGLSWPSLIRIESLTPIRQTEAWSGTILHYRQPVMAGCPLVVHCTVYSSSLQVGLNYDPARIDEAKAEMLVGRYGAIVDKLAASPKN